MPSFFATIPRVLLPLFLIYGGIRLLFWWVAFPNPDEAYYWLWGQHPDWSYYDHPPLIAWTQALFSMGFGRSLFVLRLPNVITNGLLFYLYYRICRYLYGSAGLKHFWLTIALLLASPLYFLFLGLAWPDHLLMLLTVAGTFSLITFLDSYAKNGRGESWRLYGAAIALGLALLAKYNASFVLLGLIIVLIRNKQYRPLLRDRRFYLAATIVILSLTPILLWNLSNNFQSLRYYATRSVDSGGQLIKVGECLGFIALSILTFSSINSYVLVRLLRQPKRWVDVSGAYWHVALSVFWASTGILLFLSLISTALYYWNIAAYLLMLPLLPTFFLRQPGAKSGWESNSYSSSSETKLISRPRLFWGGQVYGLLFALLLGIHYAIVPISAFFSGEGDPDTRMLYGWQAIATAVTAAKQDFVKPPVLVTTDYRSASALAYALNDPNVVAVSDRIDQFDFWYGDPKQPNKLRQQEFQGRDALILSDDWHPVSPEVLKQFETVSSPITIPIRQWNLWIKNYYIFKAENWKLHANS